jgi:hypothetical protein
MSSPHPELSKLCLCRHPQLPSDGLYIALCMTRLCAPPRFKPMLQALVPYGGSRTQ